MHTLEYVITDGTKLLAKNGYVLGAYNPHNVAAWLVCHPLAGNAICIGSHEQEALDSLCDETNYFNILAVTDDDLDSMTSLGNDGALYELDDLVINKIITA